MHSPLERWGILLLVLTSSLLVSCTSMPKAANGGLPTLVSSAASDLTRVAPGDSPSPAAAKPTTTVIRAPSVTPTATVTLTPSVTPTPIDSPLPTPLSLSSPLATIPVYSYRVVNAYPHDPEAFTQGLIYLDGILYEGTGLLENSMLRQVRLETGEVVQEYSLPPEYFGEGVTVFGDWVIQLTWQSRQGFVYDRESLDLIQEFEYATEGWGITHDGEQLIMSDGTATLYFWDPETFEEIGRIQVYDDEGPVGRLNELEYIRGEVYANVWLTDRIAIIDVDTGQVTAYIDLTGLLDSEAYDRPVDVLNGIAYDDEGDRLFVTGKWWPRLFEIELVPERLE